MKIKNYRNISLMTAAVLLLSSVTGCSGNHQETKKTIKIGVTLYDQYDTFISELIDQFNDYVSAYNSSHDVKISVEINDASGSQSTQNEQVKVFLEQNYDVFCVNLVDRTEPTTITDMAEKKNVPIIFFNRELVAEDLERWDQLYYVGADAFQSGIMEGQLAAQAYLSDEKYDRNKDGICQYFVLEGEPGHQDAIVRTESSINALTDAGLDTEKVGYAIANWNRAQAKTKTSSALSQYGDSIELILANNDDMALGAIDALTAAGYTQDNWPVVAGIDGTDVGMQAIKDQLLTCTVYNDKEGQAKGMLDLVCALALDEDLSALNLQDGKYIRMPYYTVTLDSLSEDET